MNPFEYGVVAADGLHALNDRGIVKKGFRNVEGKKRRFFYNPMWNYLGDVVQTPPGTYYFNSGKNINFYWYMFDQILIRTELLDAFGIESIKIITEVSGSSLLDNSGKPNIREGSDHLPVILKLDL